MYSFAPMIDKSDSHIGFYFVLVCVIVFGLMSLWVAFQEESWLWAIGTVVFCGIVLAITYNNSYTPNHPKNEVVTGKFVGYVAEGYNERSGKSRADHHYTYVVYAVPEGQVMLRACEGCAYPTYATLYKN